jgi:hypothetical protein
MWSRRVCDAYTEQHTVNEDITLPHSSAWNLEGFHREYMEVPGKFQRVLTAKQLFHYSNVQNSF